VNPSEIHAKQPAGPLIMYLGHLHRNAAPSKSAVCPAIVHRVRGAQ
jgi:hypothetical protein